MDKLITFLFTAAISLQAYAQQGNFTIAKSLVISSTHLQEDRQLLIFTPEDYESTMERYPVFYLLDAEWHFHYVSGLIRQMSNSGDIPKMVVVGIVNTRRNRDLTPPGTNDPPNFGGAEKFRDFLTLELQPYIDKHYRTHPYNVLAGHSFGGLFTIYTMMDAPQKFQSYIALSPSLGRNDEQQVKVARSFFQKGENLPKDLFLAVGNEGGLTYLSTKKFMRCLPSADPHTFRWTFQHFTQEGHASVPIRGFLEGLSYVFDGYNLEKKPELDDVFLVEQQYQQLSDRLGYALKVPEAYYQKFALDLIGERELEYAFFVLGKYKEHYPNSPRMLLACADAHLLNGDFESAKKYYLKLKAYDPENTLLLSLLRNIDN